MDRSFFHNRATGPPLLKRHDVWLGVGLGCIAGIVLGFFLGFSSRRPLNDRHKQAAAVQSGAPQISIDFADGKTTATPSPKEWLTRSAARFEDPPKDLPTPGIDQAIMEALQTEPPFGQARMLVLIDMMRKEDFPVALELMRRAKTQIHNTTMGQDGPPMWIAFWRRFGQIDPETALSAALNSSDLTYANRQFLEKHLFTGMARAKASTAAQDFLAHPELLNRDKAVGGLINEWVQQDPNTALAWARNLEGNLLQSAFYSAAWGASGDLDISGGNALVKVAPEGAAREGVIRSLKSQITQKSFLPAYQLLEFIETTREVGARDLEFEVKVAVRCAESDPYAAATFFAQPAQEGSASDYKGLQTVASNWIRRDPAAAENWAKGKEGDLSYQIFAAEFLKAAQERNDAVEAQRWIKKVKRASGTDE
jgi:hypothetical protein